MGRRFTRDTVGTSNDAKYDNAANAICHSVWARHDGVSQNWAQHSKNLKVQQRMQHRGIIKELRINKRSQKRSISKCDDQKDASVKVF